MNDLNIRVSSIEKSDKQSKPVHEIQIDSSSKKPASGDDDVDLFASDSEEEESEAAAKLREERLSAYNAKKSKSLYLALVENWSILIDFVHRTGSDCQIKRHSGRETVGRRNRHESVGELRQENQIGWPSLGSG